MQAVLRARSGALVADGRAWTGPITAADDRVLARVEGPVLDIGCGPGRHVLALARRGIVTLGIDVSLPALAMACHRNAPVLERSVFSRVPAAGRWGTALLLDGNVGIGGHPELLLERVTELLRPGGRIVVEVSPPGTSGAAAEQVRFEVDGVAGPWFDWAAVDLDALQPIAGARGSRCRSTGSTTGGGSHGWREPARPGASPGVHEPGARHAGRGVARHRPRGHVLHLLRDGTVLALRAAPAVMVRAPRPPGRALPLHPGPARRHRARVDPLAAGQALGRLPEALPLAAVQRGRERGGAPRAAPAHRRRSLHARLGPRQHQPLVPVAVQLRGDPLLDGVDHDRRARGARRREAGDDMECGPRAGPEADDPDEPGGDDPDEPGGDDAVAAATADRRGFLAGVFATSGLVTLFTVGQTFRPLAPLALLAPRRPDVGPQGFPVNRTARTAGVLTSARSEEFRLVVDGRVERRLTLTLEDVRALPQHTAVLPIACVEGWSSSQTWTGVRLADLLEMAGARPGASARVHSLQQRRSYRTSDVNFEQAHDPDTLLALRVGGEELALDHGYPVRLIGPNRPGVMQTKWVTRVEVRR